MTQVSIDWEQPSHLERVSQRIEGLVLAYCRSGLANGARLFNMAHLVGYVGSFVTVAPDSPGRILRQLRRKGLVSYRVVNRAASIYELTAVK